MITRNPVFDHLFLSKDLFRPLAHSKILGAYVAGLLGRLNPDMWILYYYVKVCLDFRVWKKGGRFETVRGTRRPPSQDPTLEMKHLKGKPEKT